MVKLCTVDLGFGWTKGKSNRQIYLQPSILGETKPLFEESVKDDDIVFNDDFFVGKLALRQSDVKYFSMNDNKTETWISDILLKTAIGSLCRMHECNLVTGLPVKYYFSQKDKMGKTLSLINGGDIYKIKNGLSDMFFVKPKVCNFKIVPQGLGIAIDYIFGEDGKMAKPEVAKKKILVIDLGYYTLNLLGLDKMEIMKESNTLLLGVDSAYKLLQRYIQEYFGKSPSRYELDPFVLSGEYEGTDITPLINRAFRSLSLQIQNEIESLNIKFDYFLIGGGAANKIESNISHPNKFILDQLSQIRGYEKIGVRQWK
ncbi:hypothetical protein GCM10023310_68730 [Paenibacillus vulneris]|uniref:Actin-like protein N-terminal domain-containing protein n=1 Tax=Paenibacillus vulneris TaxID=1133364 RepID=A0ABW3UGY3_9BACL